MDEIRRLQREMKRLYEEYARYPFERRMWPMERRNITPGARVPVADVRETDTDIVARIELPGVNKKDVQLRVTDDSLEIKVERKHEERIEKERFTRFERAYAGYYRRVPFPAMVIPEKAKAHYENGVLEVTVPKAEEPKKSKKVDID